jgi:hypothetical protein
MLCTIFQMYFIVLLLLKKVKQLEIAITTLNGYIINVLVYNLSKQWYN